MCWAEFNPPFPQPPPALVLLCMAYNLYVVDISDLPYGGLYNARCFQMLYAVCHALNPTAGNTRKQWNHTAKLSCNTISWNHFLNLWNEWSWQNCSNGLNAAYWLLDVKGWMLELKLNLKLKYWLSMLVMWITTYISHWGVEIQWCSNNKDSWFLCILFKVVVASDN